MTVSLDPALHGRNSLTRPLAFEISDQAEPHGLLSLLVALHHGGIISNLIRSQAIHTDCYDIIKIDLQKLTIVTFTQDMELAKEYETLLKNNDIPVMIKPHKDHESGDKFIAILVPEDFIDEAHVVIESQNAFDDFYDLDMDEDDLFGDVVIDEEY